MSRDTRACNGPCTRTYHRAWDTYDQALTDWHAQMEARATNPTDDPEPEPPAEPTITPTLGDPLFCARCVTTIRKALTEVDRLAALLDSWSDGHRGAASGEKVSRRAADAGVPSPIALTLDTLYGEVTDVEDEWRQARGYAALYRGRARGAHSRAMAVAFIVEHLADILASPDYVEFGGRVLKWERLLLAQTKSDPVVRRRPGRCPRCQCKNVLFTRDDGFTECRFVDERGKPCGKLMNDVEYERDVIGAEDDEAAVGERRMSA